MKHVIRNAVLLGISASTVGAQPVPTRALTTPTATFDEPFTWVGGLRELRDGRVVVADRRDNTLQLIDFARGVASPIGREGAGPGEYGLPMSVLPLPADTTLVWDAVNNRFLTVLPNGKPGNTFRIEDAPQRRQGGPGVVIAPQGLRNPRAIDARGRLYFEGSPIKLGPDGPQQADSVPIIRYDRRSRATDTLAWLQMPKNAASVQTSGSANQRNVNIRVGSNVPFDARDSWTVFPDGRIAVVRIRDYHVDIITPGGRTVSGPAVPFQPVRVGSAEKAEYRALMGRTPAIRMSVTDNGGAQQRQVSTAPAPFDEPDAWPATKAPFVNTGIYVRDNGDIWVHRQVKAGDPPTFDVFSGTTARLSQRITLPRGHRLVGFGTGTVYSVRSDEDDLQYLMRFKL